VRVEGHSEPRDRVDPAELHQQELGLTQLLSKRLELDFLLADGCPSILRDLVRLVPVDSQHRDRLGHALTLGHA
jgi:hypothetical protein